MPVKTVYTTINKDFEVSIDYGLQISLIIRDFKMDASSKSCELIFDELTLRSLALEIMKTCNVEIFTKKSKL